MVQVRLTDAFRFVVVGAPSYLSRQGRPERPDDLLGHECMTFRMSTGALSAWELERGRRSWRVPVRGGVVTNDGRLRVSLAEQGLGLTYVFEPMVAEQLRTGRLQVVLESYAATVPGFFLYFPNSERKVRAAAGFHRGGESSRSTRAMRHVQDHQFPLPSSCALAIASSTKRPSQTRRLR